MKRRWKQTAGFTLVELIVVIAILGILAGVAVPTYSGYVKKANMAADQSLISDIINAGQLSYYSNPVTPEGAAGAVYGYAVLTENGLETDDPTTHQALTNTFGANYDANKLKSKEWTKDAALSTLNSVGSMDISDSSFVKHASLDNLMGDVQHCSSSLAAFLAEGNYQGKAGAAKLDEFIGNGTYVQDYLDDYADSQITGDVLGNAVVFGLANQLKDDPTKAREVQKDITSGNYILRNWSDNSGQLPGVVYDSSNALNHVDVSDEDLLTKTAATYAALEAFSAYIGYDMQVDLTGGQMAILNNLTEQCNKAVNYALDNNYPERKAKAFEYLQGDGSGAPTQAAKDAQAYMDVMKTVSDVKDDYKGDLTNTNLFGSEQMIGRVNGYAAFSTSKEVLAEIESLLQDDDYGVAVIFSVTPNGQFNSFVAQTAADPRK